MPRNAHLFILLLVATFAGAFVFATLGDDDKQKQDFEQHYKIYSLPIPDEVVFAGKRISLEEFDVKERFDRELLTNVYWQSQTILMLKRANRFFPVIEKILKEEGIPADMKYIAMIESGFQNLTSPVGAQGFWQFLDRTARQYGLLINDEVDERYHLEKATRSACRYFRESYATFNDWSLVAASYNMGIEGLKNQMQQQYGNTYFDLLLNVETARYMFRALAMKEIYEHPVRYGFYIPPGHLYQTLSTRTMKVNSSITDMAKWAQENGSTYKALKLLNPWLRKNSLKIGEGEVFEISLPSKQ